MTAMLGDVFADTAFWLALVVRQDAYHTRAHFVANRITGQITTTAAVLVETASALARPLWRPHAIRLINHLKQRADVKIIGLDSELLDRGWTLYCDRMDKGWSWVDCISFVVMQDNNLDLALTTDHHFEQAGFRAVLIEDHS